jgi:hypothetical protein
MVPHSIPGCPNNRVGATASFLQGLTKQQREHLMMASSITGLTKQQKSKASVPHATKRGTLQGMIVKTIRPC